jgi:hypothetical protein
MGTEDSLQSTVVRALMMVVMMIMMMMMMMIIIIITIIITINDVPLNVQSADRTVSLSSVDFDTR